MPLHYVTGPAGAGKSAAAQELQTRGYLSYDTDDQQRTRMFGWFTRQSAMYFAGYNEISMIPSVYRDLIWRPSTFALGQLAIDADLNLVYVCGKLEDPQAILDLSEKSDGRVVFLSVSDATVRSRLKTREGDPHAPEWGKQEWQRDASVEANQDLEAKFMAMGAVMLNGEQPLDDVVDGIIRETT